MRCSLLSIHACQSQMGCVQRRKAGGLSTTARYSRSSNSSASGVAAQHRRLLLGLRLMLLRRRPGHLLDAGRDARYLD